MAGDKEGGKGEAEEGELLQNFEARLKERLPYLQQRINFHERRLKGEAYEEPFGIMSNWCYCSKCSFRSFRPSVDAMHHFTIMRKRRTRGQPAHEPWANAIQVGVFMAPPVCDYCQASNDDEREDNAVCEACMVQTEGRKTTACRWDDSEHRSYAQMEDGGGPHGADMAAPEADAEEGADGEGGGAGGAGAGGGAAGGGGGPPRASNLMVPEGFYPGWSTRVSQGAQKTDKCWLLVCPCGARRPCDRPDKVAAWMCKHLRDCEQAPEGWRFGSVQQRPPQDLLVARITRISAEVMDGNKYFKFTKDLAIAVHDELASLVASGQLEADEELKDALKAWQAAAVPHGAPRGTGTGRARTGLGGRRRKGQWTPPSSDGEDDRRGQDVEDGAEFRAMRAGPRHRDEDDDMDEDFQPFGPLAGLINPMRSSKRRVKMPARFLEEGDDGQGFDGTMEEDGEEGGGGGGGGAGSDPEFAGGSTGARKRAKTEGGGGRGTGAAGGRGRGRGSGSVRIGASTGSHGHRASSPAPGGSEGAGAGLGELVAAAEVTEGPWSPRAPGSSAAAQGAADAAASKARAGYGASKAQAKLMARKQQQQQAASEAGAGSGSGPGSGGAQQAPTGPALVEAFWQLQGQLRDRYLPVLGVAERKAEDLMKASASASQDPAVLRKHEVQQKMLANIRRMLQPQRGEEAAPSPSEDNYRQLLRWRDTTLRMLDKIPVPKSGNTPPGGSGDKTAGGASAAGRGSLASPGVGSPPGSAQGLKPAVKEEGSKEGVREEQQGPGAGAAGGAGAAPDKESAELAARRWEEAEKKLEAEVVAAQEAAAAAEREVAALREQAGPAITAQAELDALKRSGGECAVLLGTADAQALLTESISDYEELLGGPDAAAAAEAEAEAAEAKAREEGGEAGAGAGSGALEQDQILKELRAARKALAALKVLEQGREAKEAFAAAAAAAAKAVEEAEKAQRKLAIARRRQEMMKRVGSGGANGAAAAGANSGGSGRGHAGA